MRDTRGRGLRTAPRKRKPTAISLASRVAKLEEDMHEMRSKMAGFGEDLAALKTAVKHVDERTLRGEKLMMSMQMESRHTSKVVDAIAAKLQVNLPPATPVSAVPPEEPDDDDDLSSKE